MYVEAVNGVDTQRQDLAGIFLTTAGGGGEDGYIHILQFGNIFHYIVCRQFGRLVFCTISSYDTGNLEILCCLKGLHSELTDVSIAYNGCSDLFHSAYLCFKITIWLQKYEISYK